MIKNFLLWFLFALIILFSIMLKVENRIIKNRVEKLELLEERNRKCVIYLMGKTEDMEYEINKDIEKIIKSIENSDGYEI